MSESDLEPIVGRNRSFVTSIKYCHEFQLDLAGDFNRCGQGESLYGEKFSPIPGKVFQLKFLNLDNARFIIFLKNCGNESVNILQFKVKSDLAGKEVEKNSFWLSPEGVQALPDLAFQDFLQNNRRISWCTEYHKRFQCLLEIVAPGKLFFVCQQIF